MQRIPKAFFRYNIGSWILAMLMLLLFLLSRADLRDALTFAMFSQVLVIVVVVFLSGSWRHRKNPYEEAAPLVLLFMTGLTTIFSLLEIGVFKLLGGFQHEELLVVTVLSLLVWAFVEFFCSSLIMWASHTQSIAIEEKGGPWKVFLVVLGEGLVLGLFAACWFF